MAYDLYEKDGDTGDEWVWKMLAMGRKVPVYLLS